MPDVFRVIAQLEDRARSVTHLHGIKWIFGTPEDEEL
jgi:hypothetical protein